MIDILAIVIGVLIAAVYVRLIIIKCNKRTATKLFCTWIIAHVVLLPVTFSHRIFSTYLAASLGMTLALYYLDLRRNNEK